MIRGNRPLVRAVIPGHQMVQHRAESDEILFPHVLGRGRHRKDSTENVPKYRVFVVQTIEPEQSTGPGAHRKHGASIHLHIEALYTDLAALPLVRRDRASDSQVDDHALGSLQQVRYPPGQTRGVQLEAQLHLFAVLPPVHVLAESAQINRFAPDQCPLRVEFAGLDRVTRQCKRVEHARLSGAVRPRRAR